MHDSLPELPPELAARYDVVAELGEGGQGVTYRATNRETSRDVAIKRIELATAGSWKDLELFEREAKLLQQLEHPAIPRVIDTAMDAETGVMHMVREHAEGETLHEILEREETFDEEQAKHFLLQMLDVLEYLRSCLPPVVHRDIKPPNIVRRPDGSYALIDFGGVSAKAQLTGGSTFVGTNGYMPAEQLMGRADHRSDLYALGATTIQMLTGMHPSNLVGDGMRMRTDILDDAASLRPVLERLVEPTPERRYQTAQRVREVVTGGAALVLAEDKEGGLQIRRTSDSLEIGLPPIHRYVLYHTVGWIVFYAIMQPGMGTAIFFSVAAILGIGLMSLRIWQHRRLVLTDKLTYTRKFGLLPATTWSVPIEDIVDINRPGMAKHSDLLSVQTRDGTRKRFGFSVEQPDLDRISEHIRRWKEERAP